MTNVLAANEQSHIETKVISFEPKIDRLRQETASVLDLGQEFLNQPASRTAVSIAVRMLEELEKVVLTVSPFNDRQELIQAIRMLASRHKNILEADTTPNNKTLLEANKRQLIGNDHINLYAQAA